MTKLLMKSHPQTEIRPRWSEYLNFRSDLCYTLLGGLMGHDFLARVIHTDTVSWPKWKSTGRSSNPWGLLCIEIPIGVIAYPVTSAPGGIPRAVVALWISSAMPHDYILVTPRGVGLGVHGQKIESGWIMKSMGTGYSAKAPGTWRLWYPAWFPICMWQKWCAFVSARKKGVDKL